MAADDKSSPAGEAAGELKDAAASGGASGGASKGPLPPSLVVVHPLVLLSVLDHYNRVAKDTKKRVIGVLLGETYKGRVDVTNSFAVPFEEDDKDKSIWFLDHSYLETMFRMFKRINAKERVVGWYSTGTTLSESDIDIDALMRDFSTHPLLLLVDAQPKEEGLPCKAFVGVEESGSQQLLISAAGGDEAGEPSTQETSTRDIGHSRTFAHVPCQVGAYEAEENAVEHLLRDVRDATYSKLSKTTRQRFRSLESLKLRLQEIRKYVDHVLAGEIPLSQEIMAQLQDALNALPASSNATKPANGEAGTGMSPATAMDTDGAEISGEAAAGGDALGDALTVTTNDMMLSVYTAALSRGTIALHNLINNKLANREAEAKSAKKDDTTKKESGATESGAAKS
ncbi:26S proteasome regulatory subunit [Pseudoscourfieldia marina]